MAVVREALSLCPVRRTWRKTRRAHVTPSTLATDAKSEKRRKAGALSRTKPPSDVVKPFFSACAGIRSPRSRTRDVDSARCRAVTSTRFSCRGVGFGQKSRRENLATRDTLRCEGAFSSREQVVVDESPVRIQRSCFISITREEPPDFHFTGF